MMQTTDQYSRIQGPTPHSRNPFFAIFKGETLQQAMIRHRCDYGPGRLLLLRDFNGILTRERNTSRHAAVA